MSSLQDIIVDALFGFSFKPPVRPAFEATLVKLSTTQTPVASIDIPSGKVLLYKSLD